MPKSTSSVVCVWGGRVDIPIVSEYSRTSEQRTLWERDFCPFFGGCPYLGGSLYFDILYIYIISKMFKMGR